MRFLFADINIICIFVVRNRNDKAMKKPVLKAYVINVANDVFLISLNRETAVAAMEDIAGSTAGRITVEAVRGG